MRRLKNVAIGDDLLLGNVKKSDIVSAVEVANKEAIIKYLYGGYCLLACGGVVSDIYDTSIVIGPPDLMTDGTWTWYSILGHYLSKYNIKLPQAFLDHMERRQWQHSQLSEEEKSEIINTHINQQTEYIY